MVIFLSFRDEKSAIARKIRVVIIPMLAVKNCGCGLTTLGRNAPMTNEPKMILAPSKKKLVTIFARLIALSYHKSAQSATTFGFSSAACTKPKP